MTIKNETKDDGTIVVSSYKTVMIGAILILLLTLFQSSLTLGFVSSVMVTFAIAAILLSLVYDSEKKESILFYRDMVLHISTFIYITAHALILSNVFVILVSYMACCVFAIKVSTNIHKHKRLPYVTLIITDIVATILILYHIAKSVDSYLVNIVSLLLFVLSYAYIKMLAVKSFNFNKGLTTNKPEYIFFTNYIFSMTLFQLIYLHYVN